MNIACLFVYLFFSGLRPVPDLDLIAACLRSGAGGGARGVQVVTEDQVVK